MITDERATHFWDHGQRLGIAYGKTIELPRARTLAWDIYFTFGSGTKWAAAPPAPVAWAHQLAFDERMLGNGDAIRASIESLLAE